MQFPIQAAGTLLGMYALIEIVGKEVLNPLLLSYMGVCGSLSIKSLLLSTNMPVFESLDEKKLFRLKLSYFEID